MIITRGKYTRVEMDNPLAVGRCDGSGFIGRHADMQRQMEFRGSALAWTGFLRIPKFLDKPNPQMMPPVTMPDPIPIQYPRPYTFPDKPTSSS